MRITILLCLVVLSVCLPKSDTNFLWPRPLDYTYDDDGEDLIESPPCLVFSRPRGLGASGNLTVRPDNGADKVTQQPLGVNHRCAAHVM